MNDTAAAQSLSLTERAGALRAAFDRSFAEPRAPDSPAGEALLTIRVGVQLYALRIAEIGGVFADRKVAPLPGAAPGLLGIAGFRGAVVPVYDLHVLLGHAADGASRWLVTAVASPVAFAFAAIERQVKIGRDAVVPHRADGQQHRFIRGFVQIAELFCPLLHLPSVLDALKPRNAENADRKEP